MDRRAFIAAIAVNVLVAPLPVRAQPSDKVWRIGLLRRRNVTLPREFSDAMREFGWIQGRNFEIVTRLVDTPDQMAALATDLVKANVDLVLAIGTPPTVAAKRATRTIPIVFSVGADPVESGLVVSLARPGSNLTGFANLTYEQKQLEVLKDAMPRLPLVAYVSDGGNMDRAIEHAARSLEVRVIAIRVQTVDDVLPFYAAARKAGAGAVVIPDIQGMGPNLERYATEATRQRLPAVGYSANFAAAGGLLAYGPNRERELQTIAAQVNKILKGAKPADLPVEQPTKFDLVVNLKTAKALGITVAQPVLLRATDVIQ